MSIIDNDHELDRILESTNLDKYKLIDLPMEQTGDSSHEHQISSHFRYGKYIGAGMIRTPWRKFNRTSLGSWPLPGVFFDFLSILL